MWKQWGLVLGAVVLVGFARVSQQTAIRLQGYALGRQAARLHALENDTMRLRADVLGLESPARLARLMQDSRQPLVAQVTLPAVPRGARLAQATDIERATD